MPAHIPADDARQLFAENRDHTWSGLLKIVEGHRGKADGIEDEIVLMLIPVIKRLDASGAHYPFDPDDFQRVIDRALAEEYAA